MLGYVFGLAGAQCLFFALLRLKSRSSQRPSWTLNPAMAAATHVVQALLVLTLPGLLASPPARQKKGDSELFWWLWSVRRFVGLLPSRDSRYKSLVLPATQLCVMMLPAVLHSAAVS